MIRSTVFRMSSSALLAGLMLVGTGCKSEKKSETGGDTAAKPAAPQELTIALLLPESKTMRYESFDRPYFEQKVRQLCSECKIIYSNADQDASKQQNQAEAALTNGAKVLVLDPVDSLSVVSVVARARQSKIPVVSYDRLILNADVDYYISFDNEKIGQLQGQALVDKLKADGKDKGTIVVINGSPTDNNAKLYKNGAHSVIDGSGLVIGAEYDTAGLEPRQGPAA
ncbi:substrate-binding domain-containing protein, partial [Stigmatella aurantiaca]|uniref:substrate-binding domain-containing protein n=1 Tax=Stigmatella aurantiaca TaxID=41 RepID=UPI0005612328